MTFKDDPLSIRTFGKVQSLTLVVMCKALVLPCPFGGISSAYCPSLYFLPNGLSYQLKRCVARRLISTLLAWPLCEARSSALVIARKSWLVVYVAAQQC